MWCHCRNHHHHHHHQQQQQQQQLHYNNNNNTISTTTTPKMLDTLLPLPFRVLVLLLIACWLWTATYAVCDARNINLLRLLKLDPKATAREHYNKCINATGASAILYLLYRLFHTDNDTTGISIWDVLPLVAVLWLLVYLCSSDNTSRLTTTLKRISAGNIDRDIRTNDILLSDTLTSLSRVFVDLALCLCHLSHGQTCLPSSSGSKLDRHCGEQIFLDTMVGSIPNFIRLSQCYREWKLTRDSTHLYNFAKYSSSIPVLVIGLLMRQHEGYTHWWILFALVNSCYTFYWDVTKDWNFSLFGGGILRTKLHNHSPNLYCTVIILDFIGRFIWITKLFPSPVESSPLLYHAITSLFVTESGWFALEIIELLRRWLWVLIKVEVDYQTMASRDIEMNNLD